MGDHTQSLVEVSSGQTSGVDPSSDQLGTISNRIKGANIRKISSGAKSHVDATDYHREEDTLEQAN